MSAGAFGAYPEHHFKRVIPGDIATVRARLCDVLEDFNYIVLSDTPIQAKRDKTVNVWVSTMLDCDARLTIGLKAISPVSTSATFDYAVPYLFTLGDMQALEREAEAIIAVAARPLNQTVCHSCSTENGGAVRFCRSCGAPVARNKLPGEIEVMRLTAGISSSQQEIILGLIIALLSVLSTLPMINSSNAKAGTVGWVLLSVGELVASIFLLSGLRRMHRTLHPKSSRQELEADLQPAISENERLAIASQPASVTEGTTSLIEAPEPVPVSQQGKNTDPML
jgi:hypothetical protein